MNKEIQELKISKLEIKNSFGLLLKIRIDYLEKVQYQLGNDLFQKYKTIFEFSKNKNYTFIEPSARTGNFLDGLFKWNVDSKQIKAYDIEPKNNLLIKVKNFLDINFKRMKLDRKTTITIGNPPFGKKSDSAPLKFLNKSLEHSAIVTFILLNIFRRYLTQAKVRSSA